MSYNRSFSRTVAIPYCGSKTVSYPASERGGTMTVSYSGTAYEQVEVDVHVNTDPFDASVSRCNSNVNALTASVGAMNTAQCVAIADSAERVSKTLIDGFFQTVRSDLASQRAELEQRVDARLLLLRQQAQTLREKQQKMSDDYARTSARYQKIFDDINKELSVRIHQVDQPVFNLVRDVDTNSDRMLHTDMVQTAVTAGKESSMLQAQIGAAMVKNHALEAMGQAQDFLVSKARSERTIHESCIDGNGTDTYMVPICYMRTEDQQTQRQCAIPQHYAERYPQLSSQLCDTLDQTPLPGTDAEQLKSYVQNEMAERLPGNDAHSIRVREMINQLLNK